MLETKDIEIDQIKANRYQPRETFDSDSLFELAQSIRENGLIQPIIVRPVDDHYEIIAGERRYRASILAGLTSVSCVVNHDTDQQSAQKALIENIQRENLNAIEEARAYQSILSSESITQEQLAKRVGKSQSAIANKLRLLNLSQPIQEAISDRKITERHARAMIGMTKDKQEEVLDAIVHKGLNVAQTEKLVEVKRDKPSKLPQSRGYSKNTKIAVNTIQQAVKMVEKIGISCSATEEETENEVIITVRIAK